MSAAFEEFKKVCKRVCCLRDTPSCEEETCLFLMNRPEWEEHIKKIEEDVYKELGISEELIDKLNAVGTPNIIFPDEIREALALQDEKLSKEVEIISVNYEKLKEETIMNSVQKIVDGYFGEEITIDANQVVDAFEKYRKKKPYKNGITRFSCPTCGHEVKKYYNYCLYCGQHLDWSAEDGD